jgi:hypothetical protein
MRGGVGAFAAEEAVLLAFERVVVDEEVLELFDPLGGKVFQAADIGVPVIGIGDSDEAVVADSLLPVELLTFDDTDEASADRDAREGGFVHEEQDVDGIAIGREGAREPKSQGKAMPAGRTFLREKMP